MLIPNSEGYEVYLLRIKEMLDSLRAFRDIIIVIFYNDTNIDNLKWEGNINGLGILFDFLHRLKTRT